RAALDSAELNLGWTRAEVLRLGILTQAPEPAPVARGRVQGSERFRGASIGPATAPPAAGAPPRFESRFWRWDWSALLGKLLGLALTGVALSLGAPFWFDTLNRFINIRGAGRAPDEKAKSPETQGKRPAERPTK
ncbi:MAG TPA: hypothetical protein VHG91_03765, partial [Longimicrobium sp.]|nr:hypothetical protein [Longimicrobium sp.]